MHTLHLTDIVVSKLKPAANRTYWDDATPGFGIRVGKRAKTWTVMRGVHRDRMTLGHYPALSLSDARTVARMLLAVAIEPTAKPGRGRAGGAGRRGRGGGGRGRAI